jgi:hypothetical protein
METVLAVAHPVILSDRMFSPAATEPPLQEVPVQKPTYVLVFKPNLDEVEA